MAKKGLIHIYTGDGKGKTTASIGLCVRASGAAKRVAFVQFMKGMDTSELEPLRSLGVNVVRTGTIKKFIPQMNDEERTQCADEQRKAFEEAKALAPELDLLVLDEIISSMTTGMLDQTAVLNFLTSKPETLEVVLTGRDVPAPFAEIADYLSNIQALKHPYEQGISARKGIEF